MVFRSWNLPHTAISGTDQSPATECPLWGSVRLSYTVCAFLSNVLQMAMRNMLGLVILYMVKPRPEDFEPNAQTVHNLTTQPVCGDSVLAQRACLSKLGDLPWTRKEEVHFPGVFYYGFTVLLPVAGYLADRYGGKILFIISLTMQGFAFMLIPLVAYQSYELAVIVLIFAGGFAGCGSPSLYQLFVVWSHPLERTAMLSFAYSGLIVGSICIFPLANYLANISWTMPFYVMGGVCLLYGISCRWLIYNRLEQHPRLSAAEREYLTPRDSNGMIQKDINLQKVPWKKMLKSGPTWAFVLTHILHTYGFLLLSMYLPRFLREAMHLNMKEIGYLSSAPFLGGFVSKCICVLSCSHVEKRMAHSLTAFRRILYTICCIVTIIIIEIIILASNNQKVLVVLMCVLLGASTDLGFSGYWPTLLYFAPSFAGLVSGAANSWAHISGFAAPHLVARLVDSGIKSEWNNVFYTLIVYSTLSMIIFSIFSSTKIQSWDPRSHQKEQTSLSTRRKSDSC